MSKQERPPSSATENHPVKQDVLPEARLSITCWLGRRPTLVNGPAAATVTAWFAGKVTLVFTVGVPARVTAGELATLTLHGPDCVAPTVPETVAVPVVGNGNGLTMLTGVAPGPAVAAFWPPLMRTPAAARARTAATANRR